MSHLLLQAKRQQRKLNFLITQTELYAHFMAKKLTGEEDLSGEILRKLEDAPLQREVGPGIVVDLETPGDYDSRAMKARALANVEAALVQQEASVSDRISSVHNMFVYFAMYIHHVYICMVTHTCTGICTCTCTRVCTTVCVHLFSFLMTA